MYGNQNQYQQQNGFQQPQQAASPVEMSLDSVMQGGSPGLFDKNDPVGTSHQGEITGIEAQQQTDFQTGVPLFYPNGNPKPQVVIHLKTGLRDPERNYDDGVRVFYCKGYSIPNLRAASQQAGVGNFPRVGDTIRITFSETKPSQTRGFADAKIYSFQITPRQPERGRSGTGDVRPIRRPAAQRHATDHTELRRRAAAACTGGLAACDCAAGDADPPAEGHRQDPPGHRGHDGSHPGTGACRRAIVAAGRPTAGA